MEEQGLIAGRYALHTFLGSGAFSAVYRGTDTQKNKPVAIKLEMLTHRLQSSMRREGNLMLSRLNDVHGVPHLKWCGEHNGQYVLVMSLVGQNTEGLLSLCKWKFSLKTTLMIADQLLTRLRDVHAKGVLHRDIKHDNVTIGLGKRSSTLFLIDFGLSSIVTEESSDKFVGSLSFCSINAQRGNPQSYKDDLESLAYLLVYFLKGSLPWSQHENLDGKDFENSVLALKLKVTEQSLCHDLPPEFASLLTYAKSLLAGEMPDYSMLKETFHSAGRRLAIHFDRRFDWLTRYPDGRDPTLSLQEAKEQHKKQRELAHTKLFRSSQRDAACSLSSTSTHAESDTCGVPKPLKQDSSEKLQFSSPRTKGLRKTLEDSEGPSVSQGLRAYINAKKNCV